MPQPLPITQAIIDSIEDLRDQSRLAGFDHGHSVGFEEGFKACLEQIRAKLGALTSVEPKDHLGFEQVDTATITPKPRKKRLVSVKSLGLSTKTTNALVGAGVTKIKQLTEMSPAELRKLPRVGAGSVKEIAAVLKKHGKSLKV